MHDELVVFYGDGFSSFYLVPSQKKYSIMVIGLPLMRDNRDNRDIPVLCGNSAQKVL